MGGCFSSPQAGPQPVAQAATQAVPQAAASAQDPVSQGLGDAQQAIGLIDGIYKIVEPAVLEANNRRNERSSLKRFLGPWWKEAFEYGPCMVPVLDIDDFETHLQRTNGVLTPSGDCTASAPWGYLLHALAINPGDKILTWKPASGARRDMPEGALAMDVRGTAFCHLVNLYNLIKPNEEEVEVEDKRQERGSCRLLFGWLSWTSTDAGHMIAKFEPDTIPKINSRKKLLGEIGPQLGDELWASYKRALKYGISDPEMVWPNPRTTPFSERLQCLVTNMKRLHDGCPRILTREWLEHASRIKIRAMTNGGKDDTFLMDAYKVLAQHPRRPQFDQHENTRTQGNLKNCFFFESDRFDLRNKVVGFGRLQPSSSWEYRITPLVLLNSTLESYSAEDPRSWKGELYASKGLVLTIALMNTVIVIPQLGETRGGVSVLKFTPEDALWGARVHL